MENSGKMENMAENGRETVVANGRVTVEVNGKETTEQNGKDARRTMEVDGKEVAENNENETNHERGKDTSIEERKINYRGWKAMPFIIGNETFEKLGAIGTLANLLVYLTTVFNMENVTAATIVTVFNGTCNFGTFIGAYLSDTYFGRYKTLGFAIVTSFLGLLVIDLTAAIPQLRPPPCGKDCVNCEGPTPGQLTFLFTGFVLMVIGAGGVRPCNFAFGADQFDPKTESGKRGIASFINWYFFTFTFAQLVSVTLIVYVQSNVSWAIGLGITPALMLIACVVYFAGTKIYVKVKATGSPLTSVAQVIVAAIKKRRLKPVEQPWLSLFNYIPPESINAKLSYTDQFRFLDKAAIITPQDQISPDGSPAKPWKLCSLQQVEELKCVLRVIPIWAAAILYTVSILQQYTYTVFQATQCDRRLGSINFTIPPASYIVFMMLAFTIFIPIYDRIFVPFMRRLTGKEQGITMLQRIGFGIILSILSMIISGIVEDRRRAMALTKPTLGTVPRKGAISSMSGLWLVPQLVLAGIAEAFGSVGLTEFYYKQFPENMRSIAASLFYCGMAASSYICSLLITIVHRTTGGPRNWLPEDLNKGRLDYFYYMIAAMGILDLGYFLLCAKWYRYKEGNSDTPDVNEVDNIAEK